jgi:hypothetical protein
VLRLRPANTHADASESAGSSGFAMEHLARFDAIRDELLARSLDVGDSQEQSLGRSSSGGREVYAELNRTPGAGRCELDQEEIVTRRAIGIQTPPKASSRTLLRGRHPRRGSR